MMVNLNPGDKVLVRLKEYKIVSSYSAFDQELSFEIIAIDNRGYYIYIPDFILVKNSRKLDKRDLQEFNLDKKYLDSNAIRITANDIVKIFDSLDGSFCSKCGEFNKYSKPNKNEDKFICFSCRKYPQYKSIVEDD